MLKIFTNVELMRQVARDGLNALVYDTENPTINLKHRDNSIIGMKQVKFCCITLAEYKIISSLLSLREWLLP